MHSRTYMVINGFWTVAASMTNGTKTLDLKIVLLSMFQILSRNFIGKNRSIFIARDVKFFVVKLVLEDHEGCNSNLERDPDSYFARIPGSSSWTAIPSVVRYATKEFPAGTLRATRTFVVSKFVRILEKAGSEYISNRQKQILGSHFVKATKDATWI